MEAATVEALPRGDGWQYEPKWDGFRCLIFRAGEAIEMQSKSGRPLGRYFPDIVEAARRLRAVKCVLDGELVISVDGMLSFEELQLRLHPAASRVAKLAAEHPAQFIVFDLLVDDKGRSLTEIPLSERRPKLEAFSRKFLRAHAAFRISPATTNRRTAEDWLRGSDASLDGVIAKRLDSPYRSGERDGMVKTKKLRTADCVVAGFRYATKGKLVGSLLLGLYDDEDGLLHHVGFTSTIAAKDKKSLTHELEALRKQKTATGFTGRAPGGPSRWSTERSGEWEKLPPKLVVEVQYDHFSGGRFRHGTKFLRWRPDKPPRQCTFEQIPEGTRLDLGTPGVPRGRARTHSSTLGTRDRDRSSSTSKAGRGRARSGSATSIRGRRAATRQRAR
jgi:ATP-dependent DNA ligase